MPEPLPLAAVKQMLAEEAALRPLPREALLAQQHAELFARLTVEQTNALIAELKKFPFVDTPLAIKIADMLPQYPEEIRLLFAKERMVLEEAQIAQLLDLVAQHK
ncbi:MAG: RNA polymerase [Thermoplasmata archaeon]